MTDKSARASVTGIVRRAYPVHLEARAKDGASGVSTVSGYASVVEEPYEMWDFLGSYAEVVRTGAFTKTLSETPQVQLLLNHGASLTAKDMRFDGTPAGWFCHGLHNCCGGNGDYARVARLLLAAGATLPASDVPTGKHEVDAVLREYGLI